ncbi:WD40 repeat-like protein [Aureobasidium namibiae CBS 147.97]|uniref:WD40 repeat-like protein n=1 Tax=Aureobasidium namibiae CBS 147.97 TaxID=1043004 RepID=A0A074X2E7_9PEZI|nr:WD40 repeat-like protein [Aureobasidium namibiae CBS 147.97]KEQ68821.1 WD40 repeat-like protein [Aureobasidium namibiae CBS 147.97]
MSRQEFLADFVYSVRKQFNVNGTPASWAQGSKPAHRFWGDEDSAIGIAYSSHDHTNHHYAVSCDAKLVAVCGGLNVSIYDIATQERRAQFCMSIDRANLMDAPSLVDESLAPIVSQITRTHGPMDSVIQPLLHTLRENYTKALQDLQGSLLFASVPHVDGKLCGSRDSSSRGKHFLYVTNNHGLQRGGRPLAELPEIVVYDYALKSTKFVLAGHGGYIVWTSFSPDGRYIASASHEGTCRIFDSTTGDCRHKVDLMDGQCSSGAWSPDSQHIAICGKDKRIATETGVAASLLVTVVISVETGKQVASFDHGDPSSRHSSIAWSSRNDIAITQDTDIYFWDPFSDNTMHSFSIDVEGRMLKTYAGFSQISWSADGKRLIVMCGDGTIEVWDRDANVRWRVQRPQGLTTKRFGQGFHWLEKLQMLICLNGDGYLRSYTFE